jgi:NTP pyrophosphatase (non-canonical NTP hydrolase)
MLAGELADIVGLVIINVNLLGIDLEKAIEIGTRPNTQE